MANGHISGCKRCWNLSGRTAPSGHSYRRSNPMRGKQFQLGYRGTLEERFWRLVYKTHSCWFWLGAKRSGWGYGNFWLNGRNVPAHVVAWELANKRPFPEGMDGSHDAAHSEVGE